MSRPIRAPPGAAGTGVAPQGTPIHAVPSPLTEDAIVAVLRGAGCVFAEEEARLLIAAAGEPSELAAMVARRAAGDPLEYVTGWTDFCGLRIAVDRGVFVPRHRTELLVAEAIARANPRTVVVDMCCGTGAVGLAIAHAVPSIVLHAADVDAAAVACARRNLNVNVLDGHIHLGDLYDALPAALRGTVGLLVANVPYVPTADIAMLPREARDHEPMAALDGGEDGLDLVRRLATGAPDWLARGGHVLVETSEAQAAQARRVLAAAGFSTRMAVDPELEATVVIGTRSS